MRKSAKPTILVTGPEVGEPIRNRPNPAIVALKSMPITLQGKDLVCILLSAVSNILSITPFLSKHSVGCLDISYELT